MIKKLKNTYRLIGLYPGAKAEAVGEVVTSDDNLELMYPHLFTQLYEVDGAKVAVGDSVYRLVTKGYETLVKAVKFSEHHVRENSVLYSTVCNANASLKEVKDRAQIMTNNSNFLSFLMELIRDSEKDVTHLSIDQISGRFKRYGEIAKDIKSWIENE